jgi:hypothetical protein
MHEKLSEFFGKARTKQFCIDSVIPVSGTWDTKQTHETVLPAVKSKQYIACRYSSLLTESEKHKTSGVFLYKLQKGLLYVHIAGNLGDRHITLSVQYCPIMTREHLQHCLSRTLAKQAEFDHVDRAELDKTLQESESWLRADTTLLISGKDTKWTSCLYPVRYQLFEPRENEFIVCCLKDKHIHTNRILSDFIKDYERALTGTSLASNKDLEYEVVSLQSLSSRVGDQALPMTDELLSRCKAVLALDEI